MVASSWPSFYVDKKNGGEKEEGISQHIEAAFCLLTSFFFFFGVGGGGGG